MNYYEVNDPYYAVIAAKDDVQCLKIFTEGVAEVEDKEEFFATVTQLDVFEAIKRLANSLSEEHGRKTGVKQAFHQVEQVNEEGGLLVIDRKLQ